MTIKINGNSRASERAAIACDGASNFCCAHFMDELQQGEGQQQGQGAGEAAAAAIAMRHDALPYETGKASQLKDMKWESPSRESSSHI